MIINWQPLITAIHAAKTILITTHIRPDGDAVGSTCALALALRDLGKDARIMVADAAPANYAQFAQANGCLIERFDTSNFIPFSPNLIIVVDTGTWDQVGDMAEYLRSRPVPRAVIDHHRTQDDLGGLAMIDPSAEAAGRLVYDLIQSLGVLISPACAQLLFLALAADTGWFRYANTTASTVTLAAKLMKLGASSAAVHTCIYGGVSPEKYHLIGRALGRMRCVEGIAYTVVYQSDFEATGTNNPDADVLASYTQNVAGAKIGVLLIEQPDRRVKISLRSRSPYPVLAIAEELGGGGHAYAAGAVLNGPIEAAQYRVFQLVRSVLMSVTETC